MAPATQPLSPEVMIPDLLRVDSAARPAPRWSPDAIYRPFFLAGIAVVLTLGAVWGAYLLARIAIAGRFTVVGLHEINAHGHAQIFGWVGLFVMGFAYQAFPRFKHTSLAMPRLAYLSFALMVGGVLTRSVLEALADGFDALAAVAVAGSAAEVVAIGLFALVIAATSRASGKRLETYDWYIAAGLFWFLAQAVYEAIYVAATFRAGPADVVPLVATWQGALRDLQIHGFAALMILGVSQRLLPHAFGFRIGSRRLARTCLVGLNLAIAGEAMGLVLMRLAGRAWAGLWYASVLLLAGCVVALVVNWGVFGRAAGPPDRSRKFVRAAYTWLLVSLGMLVALPAYQFAVLPAVSPDSPAAKMGFSHAYYGATRHAITVGFVSLMILGVASRVVPMLRSADPGHLTRLWLPFALINVGCTLRVVGQTATDWADWLFPLTGVSGTLEVAGLAVWGFHLAGLMLRRPDRDFRLAAGAGGRVTGREYVSDVLDRHPDLLPTFLEFGFRPLANPVLRRTAARGITIDLACRFAGVDRAALLAALNTRLPAASVSLPVLAVGPID